LIVIVVAIVAFAYFASDRVAPVELNGAHVVITGGSSGIGLECAKLLVSKGSHVTLIARDKTKLEQAKESVMRVRKSEAVQVTICAVDVSDYSALDKSISEVALKHGGKIDVLLHSAGVTKPERFSEADVKNISYLVNINFSGFAYALKLVIPYMKNQKKGRVIAVSSVAGLYGFPGYGVYSGSKFAMRGLVEAARAELSPWNIEFSLACPPNVDTPMYEAEMKIKPPEIKELEGKSTVVKPQQVAADIVDSLSNWRFFICTGTDSMLVSLATPGMSPASFQELLLQTLAAPILRVIARIEVIGTRSKLIGMKRQNKY